MDASDRIEPEAAADAGQFVTFHIEQGIFAVPLTEVQEIIRMPDLVHVPLSPEALEGLANLRGSVMAVTSLRRMFDYPVQEYDDATRVVVLNRGVPAGLVVDRMAAVVSAEPGEIEPAAGMDTAIRADFLRGVIRRSGQLGMIMILDPDRLTGAHGGQSGPAPETLQAEQGGAADHAARTGPNVAAEEVQLVSFEAAGQEYALAIEHVQEIVQMPASIARVPKSDAHVLGIMTLRENCWLWSACGPCCSCRRRPPMSATRLWWSHSPAGPRSASSWTWCAKCCGWPRHGWSRCRR
jgi:purine-binding chemotaxis protein CheW